MVNRTASESPFYLTRQSANLLEELSVKIASGGKVCLLYGRQSVGKTRLLKQLVATRCSQRNVVFAQVASDGQIVIDHGSFAGAAESDGFSDGFSLNALKSLPSNSLLIVDDFQFASAQDKRQLLACWLENSASKQSTLILAGNGGLVAALQAIPNIDLSKIDSVELLPLSFNESKQYLAFRCCDLRHQMAQLNQQQARRLRKTEGVFSAIGELAKDMKGELTCADELVRVRHRPAVWLLPAMLLLLTLTLTLSYLSDQIPPSSSVADMPSDAELKGIQAAQAEQHRRQSDSADGEVFKQSLQNNSEESLGAMSTPAELLSAANGVDLPPDPEIAPEQIDSAEDLTRNESAPEPSFLYKRLHATREWLDTKAGSTGTIQIMTITAQADPEGSVTRHVQSLKSLGMDLDQVFIYRFEYNGGNRYGVLFGEFKSSRIAYRAIDDLPDLVKRNKPIPRTVKGVRAEIKRAQASQ